MKRGIFSFLVVSIFLGLGFYYQNQVLAQDNNNPEDATGNNEETTSEDSDIQGEPQPQPTNLQETNNPQKENADISGGEGQVKISHEVLIAELLKRLDSADLRTLTEAGIALRREAKLSDLDVLVKTLKLGNAREKQLFIIEALSFLQDKRAADALRFEVEHGDVETKRAAVTALGKLNFNQPVALLTKVLRKDPDQEMKKRAASALGEIGSNSALYALRTSLGVLEDTSGAKSAAFWSLDKMKGEFPEDLISNNMPAGQVLNLAYKGTRYFFYHPANRKQAMDLKDGYKPWMLICVHDGDLLAEDLFNLCYKSARQLQIAVLVPYIDNIRFPDYSNFNYRGQRFDKFLLELVDFLGTKLSLNTRELYMFGYGMGGDFVQKFVMAYPKRIARAVYEVNSLMMPDPESYFPYGLNKSPLAPDINVDMYQFLKAEQMIVIRKNSSSKAKSNEYFDRLQHYSQINGIRNRVLIRNVDMKYETWDRAERFMFAFDN